MKKLLILGLAMTTGLAAMAKIDNPLLENFENPPFDKIKVEHYVPAIKVSIEEAQKEIQTIAANKKAPTFTNTVEAMEVSGKKLSLIASIFFNLNHAETSDALQALAPEISTLLTKHGNDISLNPILFQKVKAVYAQKETLKLTQEQERLLEKTYKGFIRNGANLNEEEKAKYRAMTEELALLGEAFSKNVLKATNAYYKHVTDEALLAGMPDFVKSAAAAAAQERNLSGWVFTLQQPSYTGLIKYADQRALREELYKAYNMRAVDSNQEIVKKIVRLRLNLANLLGYKTYSDYALEERMAENPANATKLLNDLLKASMPVAKKEVADVQKFATKQGADFKLQPWDWSYYAEKLKKEQYAFDYLVLKPYFELENTIKGVFMLSEKLYGLSYVENKSIPVYHKDVKVYDVFDQNGKRLISRLYLDFFPRAGKKAGAWMTEYRGQHKEKGKNRIPQVSLVMNFTKPTEDKPALLEFSEVETFLHEFGHALHGMLSEVTYESLSGTNVARDFVELPSQIMENWAIEKDFLDMFAVNYTSGEKIPAQYIEKIKASSNYLAGYASVRQLSFGLLDMAYHNRTKAVTEPLELFESKVLSATQLFCPVPNCLISPAFSHIFAGGYASGYYSYKWSEMLDADAYALFQEKGIFNSEVAAKFRELLSKGGSVKAADLYRNFRGQEPSIQALMKRSGFTK